MLADTIAKTKAHKIWTNPDMLGTPLFILFCDEYGHEGRDENDIHGLHCLQWHPETILKEIAEDIGAEPDAGCFNRLMASISIATTDKFYKRLPDFIILCNTLSGTHIDPDYWEPAGVYEIAWGITEALMISPPDSDEKEPFDDEIIKYISTTVKEEGLVKPPGVLRLGMKGDPMSEVRYSYEDDPDTFSGIWAIAEARSKDITNVLQARTRLLIDQLEMLPLQTGDSKNTAQKMKNLLPKLEANQ